MRDGKVQKQMRTFGTTTRELVSLREWLRSEGCTHVAMESTGVYWKPVCAILEGAFQIVVANAQQVKRVPGRKTDVKDAEWTADLLCHGLLKLQFRSAEIHSRTARLNSLSGRGHGRVWGFRSPDAEGFSRREGEPRGDGRTGQRQTAQ